MLEYSGWENSGTFTPWQERVLQRLAGAVVLLLLALLLEASPAAHGETGAAGGQGELTGPLMRLTATGVPQVGAVTLESRLELSIAGLLARATLIQRFRNDSAEWREAEYLLPLPQDAAVTHLELQLGERRIIGEIREREEARQVYNAARKAGKRSALLEQQRPHLFTTRVANVPPGEVVAVRVEMVLPVAFREGEFSLRFPTTLTPVYIPGAPLAHVEEGAVAAAPRSGTWLPLTGSGWAAPSAAVPDAPLITPYQHVRAGSDAQPLNPLSLQVDLRPGIALAQIDALYHELDVRREGDDGFTIGLRGGAVEMDRDLVLRWRARASATPQAAVFRERFDGEDFALLMLLPPESAAPPEPLPRELLLVIDVSGSMQGEPIRQARQSVLHALDALSANDFVNVIAFSDRYVSLFPRAQRANGATVERARDFVRGLDADGGTEILPALAAALRATPASEDEVSALRQIIFLTDGAVGNEEALLALIGAELGVARLFTVGIGSAPNGYFMTRAAEVGRGEAVFIARPEDVAPALNGLFRRIGQPLARDVQVQWPAEVEAFPARIPDLYAGQPLLQVARLKGAPGAAPISVKGMLVGRAWERQIALSRNADDRGVGQHWARSKLKSLLQGLQRGETREAVRELALPLALRFSLASPFTSFVAVEEEPVRPTRAPLLPGQVPNTRPQGQAPQTFAFAQGATTGPAKLYLGALFAFVALMGFTMTRSEPNS